jgi:hypothetical protein
MSKLIISGVLIVAISVSTAAFAAGPIIRGAHHGRLLPPAGGAHRRTARLDLEGLEKPDGQAARLKFLDRAAGAPVGSNGAPSSTNSTRAPPGAAQMEIVARLARPCCTALRKSSSRQRLIANSASAAASTVPGNSREQA